jgi:hypothetical protein
MATSGGKGLNDKFDIHFFMIIIWLIFLFGGFIKI